MRKIAVTFLLWLWAGPVLAHGNEPHGIAAMWTLDPWIVTPLFIVGLLYALGSAVLWRRAGADYRIRGWQAAAYFAGWMSLAIALVSPLHWLGEHVFSFHMIEHEIVMAISAPLLVMARPIGALLWALPRDARLALGHWLRRPSVDATWQWLSGGRNATLLHGLATWA
jgi:putative membrane protein